MNSSVCEGTPSPFLHHGNTVINVGSKDETNYKVRRGGGSRLYSLPSHHKSETRMTVGAPKQDEGHENNNNSSTKNKMRDTKNNNNSSTKNKMRDTKTTTTAQLKTR